MSYRACPHCGSVNPASEKICYQCQKEMPPEVPTAKPSPASESSFDFREHSKSASTPAPFDFNAHEKVTSPPNTSRGPKAPVTPSQQATFQFNDKPSHLAAKALPPDYSSTLGQGLMRGLMAGVITGIAFAAVFILGKFPFMNGLLTNTPSKAFIVVVSLMFASLSGVVLCGFLGLQSALCFLDECLKTGAFVGLLLGSALYFASGNWSYILQCGLLFPATACLASFLERMTRKPRDPNATLGK